VAITLRLDDDQELLLKHAMDLTGTNTKTKAIFYLLEHAERLLKNDAAMREIRSLESEIKSNQRLIAKLKAG